MPFTRLKTLFKQNATSMKRYITIEYDKRKQYKGTWLHTQWILTSLIIELQTLDIRYIVGEHSWISVQMCNARNSDNQQSIIDHCYTYFWKDLFNDSWLEDSVSNDICREPKVGWLGFEGLKKAWQNYNADEYRIIWFGNLCCTYFVISALLMATIELQSHITSMAGKMSL